MFFVDALDLARKFLQEAVFASRELQHRGQSGIGAGGIGAGGIDAGAPADTSGCGLGPKAAVPESFSGKQTELLGQMVQALGVTDPPMDQVEAVTAQWIKVQDGLDRKRNHFLKDFRNLHGFDRKAYAPDVEAEFKAGLEEINRDNNDRLHRQAEALVESVRRSVDPFTSRI